MTETCAFIFGMFLMCNAVLAWCCLRAGDMRDDDGPGRTEGDTSRGSLFGSSGPMSRGQE